MEIQICLFGRLSSSWSVREVLVFRSSLKREFTDVMSFDWVRRGVLHMMVTGILLPLSEQQSCVIVALDRAV